MQNQPAIKDTRKLHTTSKALAGGLLGYIIYSGWELSAAQLSLCVIVTLLAIWPIMRWLKDQPYQLPAFEAFMLTSITAYVLPMVTNHTSMDTYDPLVVTKAIFGVALFQICAIAAFFNTQVYEDHRPFWTAPLFTRDISNWLPIGLWLNFLYLLISKFLFEIPGEIDSILRAVFFGINTSCSFLLGRSWGEGKLVTGQKINITIILLGQSYLLMASLYLITALSAFLVFMLAFVSAGRKIPILALSSAFIFLSILHGGKADMRMKYWEGELGPVTLTELPGFYTEWIEYGLQSYQRDVEEKPNHLLIERASLIHMICLVVDQSSRGQPYLYGETYGHILPQLVPRFLWPNKPTGQVSKTRLSIYYGLQDEFSAKSTSIAFGQLAEAFANFGFMGLGIVGCAFGWLYKFISIKTRSAPLISNGGFFMILLMAWSLQIELPMSSWVASLYQASICVLGLPHILRQLFGQ